MATQAGSAFSTVSPSNRNDEFNYFHGTVSFNFGTHVFPRPSRPDTEGTFHKRKRYEVLTAVLTKIHIYCRVDWLVVPDVSEDVSVSVFRVLVHPIHSNVGITDFSILHAATDCLEQRECPRLPS